MRLFASAPLAFALLLASTRALAQDAEAARLGALLDHYADGAHTRRLAMSLTQVGVAAVAIPIGVYVANQTPTTGTGDFLLYAGIPIGASGLLGLVFPDPMESFAEAYRAQRDAGTPAADLLAVTEDRWRLAAKATHDGRMVGGVTGIIIGTLATGVGVTFALIPSSPSFDTSTKTSWAAALMLLGGTTLLGGVSSLTTESALEASYRAYRAGNGHGEVKPRISVGAAPARGGGVIGIGGAF